MSAKKVRVKKLIKEQRRARERAIREQERAATQKAKQDAAAARAELRAEEKRLRDEQEAQQRSEKLSAEQQRSQKQSAEKQRSEERRAEEQRSEEQGAAKVRRESASRKSSSPAAAAAAAAPAAAASSAAPAKGRSSRRDRRTRSGRPQEDLSTSTSSRGAGTRTAAVVVTAGVLAAMVGSVALDALGNDEAEAASGGIDQGAAAAWGAASVAAPSTGQSFICPPLPGQPDSLTTDGLLDYRDRDAAATSRFSAVLFATDLSGSFPESATAQLSQEARINETTLTEASTPQDAAGEQEAVAPLAEREVAYDSVLGGARPLLLDTAAGPEGSALAASALYEYQADSGPVTGLAVGQCTPPERSQWFFGPEIAAGASSLLTLANPFDRSATVEITSVDSEGDLGTSGARSVVVPGQTTRAVNIAGLASAGTDLGVSVSSSGAPVAAQLQSSRASGVIGTGIEFLPGLTETGTSHVLPGITVPEGITAADAQDDAAEGTEDGAEDGEQTGPTPPELWIHVPGSAGATVEVQVYGEDGQQSLEIPGVFTVDGGEVDVIELQGLQPGVTDIRVRTDVPAFAAVRSESAQGSDFSWAAPTEALAEGSGTLLPELGESELRLFGSGASGSIGYRVMDAEGEFGEEQTVEVPAEGAAVISAEDLTEAEPEGSEAGAAVVVFSAPELTGEGSLHAMLATTAGEDQNSLSPVQQLRGAEQYVPVRLLR